MEDIDSSTRGFCAILSRDLVEDERSLSFTYGRPVESWSSLGQMYFGKLVLEPLNFAGDIVRGGNCRKRAVLKNRSDTLFINLDNRWYLVLQRSGMSSKCFWKVS